MSGSMIPVVSGTPAAPMTDADKVDVRRFAGYPAYGAGNAGFQSWRYFTTYGLLEFRLNNMTAAEVAVVQTYLTSLRTLEAAVPTTGDNLDTAQAAVWTHNKNELVDRVALLDTWRRKLCSFMGVPPGPDFGGSARSVRLVV